MIQIDTRLTPKTLAPLARRVFEVSAPKIRALQKRWRQSDGTPVFTVNGRYTSRGWTEWTEGFVYGSAILQYDATGDRAMLKIGREGTLHRMASHVTHVGVHDHGFNNISTYGNLRRLLLEKRLPADEWEAHFYDLAIKASGAVQASRWTQLTPELGYIRSFNGPHSLFSDTIRSLRALGLAHQLGQTLMGENDRKISLLGRSIQHAETTARYNVYYGKGRDTYDVPGRVVHESIFTVPAGAYRCPSTQQGYSAFTTWTRGHAWVLCGYPEQLEFLQTLPEASFREFGGKKQILRRFVEVAKVTADFYIRETPTDGIPYWDTGAPGLVHLGDYQNRPADPFNEHEPVDSSAAAISAQGLLRLGRYLQRHGQKEAGQSYFAAGLTVAQSLFSEPYLSTDPRHEGLLLHTVYHRPNGWDHIPKGSRIPCGEAAMWGDYHLRELALYLLRLAGGKPYLTFFGETR
ncbi:MAG: glycosyl hydrolase [Verrucomicrobiota bacterium]